MFTSRLPCTARLLLLSALALATGCEAHLSDRTPPSAAPGIEGDVVGPTGEPIPGALVSATSHFDLLEPDPAHDERTDARGRFRFMKLPPGRYGLTATCADHAAAYGGVVTLAPGGSTSRVVLRVGGPSAAIQGTVLDERGEGIWGARILAPALSENEHEVYVTHADDRGRYFLRLPTRNGYFVVADAPPRPRSNKQIEPVSQVVDLRLAAPPAPRPSDAAIAGWLSARATPLAGDRDLDEAGARAINVIVGDASIVAMGEATHGSSEFAEWRRRVFQTLVRDKGFTVYAVETGWADALELDDYVVNGKGDPREAIHHLLTWKDQTEETLALAEWMRVYNADPSHTKKVRFQGFDIVTPHAVTGLLAYLRKVDPAAVSEAEKAIAPFAGLDAEHLYGTRSKEEQDRVRRAIGALVDRMDASRVDYTKRSSEAEWARGRQLARVIQQAEVSFTDYTARDGQMFENIRWLVDHHPPGTKILVDAHITHIAAEQNGLSYMGRLLREIYGARYVTIGFSFGEGSFLALDWRNGPSNVKANLSVGPAPLGTFDGDLSLANLAAFVVDLRGAEGPVGAWLRSPQRMHSIGGAFKGPDHAFGRFTPASAFDAMIYLDKVTPIRPLKN